MTFQELDQRRRLTAAHIPIVREALIRAVEEVQHRPRAVHACLRFLIKAKSVVVVLQLFEHFFAWYLQGGGGLFQIVKEIVFDFLLRIAQQRAVETVERNILQIVERREDAGTTELRHSRHEKEAQAPFVGLND